MSGKVAITPAATAASATPPAIFKTVWFDFLRLVNRFESILFIIHDLGESILFFLHELVTVVLSSNYYAGYVQLNQYRER